jgi:hypothetical protein
MLNESTQGFLLGVAAALAGVLVYACASMLLLQTQSRPVAEKKVDTSNAVVAQLDAR